MDSLDKNKNPNKLKHNIKKKNKKEYNYLKNNNKIKINKQINKDQANHQKLEK